MVYGVDECRRCGTKLKMIDSRAMDDYRESLRLPPTMSEAEWRRRGLLAMPTRRQVNMPSHGCCPDCGVILMRKRARLGPRLTLLIGGATLAFTLIIIVMSLFRAGR